MVSNFCESVNPLAAIQVILHDYPFCASILRELLQNSDDAKATKQILVLDTGKDPALMAYNDSQFQEEDWKAIRTIHESSKKADTSKIGKYGVGFRACYHVTDVPQILSGSSFVILDPIGSGGTRMDYNTFKKRDYCKRFDFFSNLFQPSSFPGTVIRLPLRSAPSELSQRLVFVQELDQMIKDYIAEELSISLLFLGNLRTIEIWKVHDDNKTCLASCNKSERKAEHQGACSIYDSVLSDGHSSFSWRIIQTQNAEDEARSRLAALGAKSVDHVIKRHKLSPDVRIAYPLFSDGRTSGRLFTFLPLPSRTNFPVHIHALFALTSSRQSLRNQGETGSVAGSDNDVLIKWNSLLFDYYIPQAWIHLLKTLAEDALCQDIFTTWPPYCSSITSGDGLYWKDILQVTLKFAIQSGSMIWPKVSEKGTTTYVDLKSSLVVARGQVQSDVLIALAHVGLTLVQLPETHMPFLDNSITKLIPRVARDQIKGRDLGFDSLSQNQRRALCEYFLSEKDFSSIHGLPLFPTLGGSYISLDKRDATSQRYIALTTDEVDVFRASAGDAISLDSLPREVAALVREQGTTQANIDLLSPPSVVAYLSSEPEPLSDQRLVKFWTWLEKWQHRDQAMALLKSNTVLHLVPTSEGPQAVSSPTFPGPDVPSFKKLGLAFVSSVLPNTVVRFLKSHEVVKDTSDMNHFLAAINLAALQPLGGDEAKSVLDHISARYRSLSSDYLAKLKKLPVFPVLVPHADAQSSAKQNSYVKWCAIHDLNIKGISPTMLIPLTDKPNFLDKSCLSDPSCSLIKALQIPVLNDKGVLLQALRRFSSQPKPLRALFVSYIRQNHRSTYSITSLLQKTRFIPASNCALQSPIEVIDPESQLKSLFPAVSSNWPFPTIEDDHDRMILDDLRDLKMMKASLSSDIVEERIAYISANHSSADALIVARHLVSLMNDRSFNCARLSIDTSLRWLPTLIGLVSSKECINCGRKDADLFDEVLTTLDETISTTSSFRSLLSWDKPLPLDVLTKQLDRVLRQPSSDIQYGKISEIIVELAGRQLGDADVKAIQEAVADRAWVPIESGTLARPSRAVFDGAVGSSFFDKISFSKTQKSIYQFLARMGCLDRPSTSTIISELCALQKKAGTDRIVVQQAVQLLEMLPESITDEERASLLIPITTGDLKPFYTVSYYRGGISSDGGRTPIGHHLISEKLATKIRMKLFGLGDAEDDIDFKGGNIIRNILRQYNPEQFFTEFVANASDAGATRLSFLLDDCEAPTEHLLSEGLAEFQNASLVVYNDGIFSQSDFTGILETGVGGKRGKTGVIGHLGLGALSMFHFTKLAMIVSGDHVLFLSPSKRNLSFCERHSLLLSLQNVKRLYADHLKPLDGLFGFDLSSTKSYHGTLFRLPLRNEERSSQNPASMIPWSIKKVEEMLLAEFDKVAYKSLLFTSLGRIEVHKWHSGKCEVLRIIKSTRIPGDPAPDDPFKSETVTFDSPTQQLPKWLVVTKDVNNIQGDYKVELAKKHNMHHLSPIRIAAALESNKVQELKYNLFCTSPLPIFTSIPAHISAPLILEQGKQNVRVDSDPPANYFQTGMESKYNRWLLSSELPCSYLYLLEKLLQIQGTNIPWWPSMPSVSVDPPSGIFIEAFWDSKTFKNPRRVFASVYDPTSSVFSNDAVLYANKANEYPGWSVTLPKVLSATRPRNVVEVPVELLEYAKKAKLRTADGTFLKTLLEADSCSLHLTLDEIDALLWYLLSKEVSLDGLPLIPLEDGSCAKICSSQNKQTKYYVVGQRQTVAYDIFPPNRLIHRKFPGRSSQCLLGLTNVSRLNDDGIAQLVKEYIASARGWPEGEPLQTRIASFWSSGLQVSLESISRLHLIQTLHPSEFISAKRMKGPSVIVIEAEKSTEGFDYVVLQQLGMTIVIKGSLPQALGEEAGKKQRPYTCFLEYMQKNEAKVLKVISGLNSSDHEALANWVRSEFSETPAALADVARKLPVWSIHQRDKLSCLGALADTTILPISIPSHVLLPFTDHPVIDWETRMQSVENEGCCTKCVTELLCVSHDTILYSEDDLMAYKQFIKWLLSRERVMGYSLLVPNEDGVLCPAKSLFERHELFLATFKATPKHLLHNGFQDLAESLGKYSLNLGCRLDLAMFMKCANAFDAGNDDKDDKDSEDRPDDWDKGRSKVLYDHFNNLPLSPGDVDWCRKLDQLKFIPRGSPNRRGYEGMDIRKYMQYSHILSLSKITLADYEAICWSQRGHVASQPNSTLCGIYGKPSGKEVVKHLRVLAELGKKYGRQSALLSDLKATYKWLNENVDELFIDIRNANRKSIFLNVDNPDSDQWVWHSALTLIQDLSQDVGGLHGVKGFLRRYNKILTAAGARSIQKVTAETVATMDETLLCRSRFRDMREHGFEVNVTFKAMDDEHQIPHAHKSWLSINSEYLWRTFVAPGFREVDPGQCAQVNASDYSSLCVKETINWIYVGELPEFIASPSNNQKEFKAKLDLALDMLSLAHRWEITKLHQRLQEFIVNKFLNPYWVKIICQCAKQTEAKGLLRACEDFEIKNQDIASSMNNSDFMLRISNY